MKNRFHVLAMAVLVIAGLLAAGRDSSALAAKGIKQWRVPIVMERATVRGKVVILETRTTERHALKDMKIEIWSRRDDRRGRAAPDQLLHETTTDPEGFFSLPVLEEGNYLLRVSDLYLKLAVIPEAEVRTGQEQEPKILLILLPKEVI